MKLSLRCGVCCLFFLLSIIASFSHTSSAHRFLHTKPAGITENTMKVLHESIEVPLADLQTSNSFNQEDMGMELECESGDEECLKKRRVLVAVADAHLDYIYTQHHKP